MGAACGCGSGATAPVLQSSMETSHIGPCGFCTKPGSGAKPNQDSYVIAPNVGGYKGAHFFAIFDGHGKKGHEVSGFLKNTVPRALVQDNAFPRNPGKALYNACVNANDMLRGTQIDSEYSGSTGCIALVLHGQLWTANVGDSRAIAGVGTNYVRPEQLTVDHTVGNAKERSRIISSGGRVKNNRVYCQDIDEPGLIPTRAFGDFSGISAGIVAKPEIECKQLDDSYKFIVLMSDGIWENVSATKICTTVMDRQETQVTKACAVLLSEAHRTVKASSSRYPDDMTLVGVHLKDYWKSHVKQSIASAKPAVIDVGPELSVEEKTRLAVEMCEQMVASGVHPEDACDAVMGLQPEERAKVEVAMAAITSMGVAAWRTKYFLMHPDSDGGVDDENMAEVWPTNGASTSRQPSEPKFSQPARSRSTSTSRRGSVGEVKSIANRNMKKAKSTSSSTASSRKTSTVGWFMQD